MAAIRTLLSSPHPKVVWHKAYDVPRVEYNGVSVKGDVHDGMVAWHVLNSDLDKGLGFVATFLAPDQPRWKHLSREQPAFYNAVDSDVALRITLATFDELRAAELMEVGERYGLLRVAGLKPGLVEKAWADEHPVVRRRVER